ncbi:alkylphosphonate utilization protein [Leucobacter sp. CSA2]|uniref:Alkylphosphonate utilization protein n=1 Tax=Leucobacter edaphi TaxID=2796472 RepID=A0A934UXD6_9MICO|nr:zinc ribbon domain-containing protein YjdM [Leucobacter edaphi]MBK0422644.1 alkylphosphonate utilization protein [Leucobacter edaphi]
MSDTLPACPECAESYTYELGALLVCPMCGHEWSADQAEPAADADSATADAATITDAVGNVLADGDTVTVVKDLKIKGGGGGTVKVGTKVKGIRLNPSGPDGHDIDATVPGFGRMNLKSSVVKKVL